jgi:hypothetical protein
MASRDASDEEESADPLEEATAQIVTAIPVVDASDPPIEINTLIACRGWTGQVGGS